MRVCDVTLYLIKLERSGFTGSVTLNFHRGNISQKVKKELSEEVELQEAHS